MHPILFYVYDNFYIGTYGVMVGLGALLGALLGVYRAKRANVPISFIIDLLFYSTIAGFIGGRVVFILVNFNDFLLHPWSYIFSRQGFVFLGGLLFAIPVAVYYTHKKRMPIGKIADLLAPSLPLAHMFGRFGCFSAGCCYGKVCTGALCKIALRFPAVYDKKDNLIGSFVYIDHLQRGWVTPEMTHSLPVIPTQLLEAGALFIIFCVLLLLSRKKLRSGHLFLLYLLLYSVWRFGIEFVRGDAERGIWFGVISTSQIITALIVVGIIVYLIREKKTVPKSSGGNK